MNAEVNKNVPAQLECFGVGRCPVLFMLKANGCGLFHLIAF